MKLSEFKQLIKQSILEEKEKEKNASGAMTPEEEKMVADYEEEEANKHALDKEEPMEEAMVSPDNRVAYLVNALDHVWNMGKGNNPIDFKSLAQSLINDIFDEETMEEVIRKTDFIIESWNKRRKLTETSTDPALEVVDWEETPKGDVRVKTADGTEEIYKFGSSDEELDYHASSEGSTAYQTYYNDDSSKELTMKVEVWGNPDSPNYGDLDFESLEYVRK